MKPTPLLALENHVNALRQCTRCPRMHRPPVSGGAVVSKILLVGQAPGDKEPRLGRPFAWTAGKKLFRWFLEYGQIEEVRFRRSVYMAAVCRCFPGKKATGGDRVPDSDEIAACSSWLDTEIQLLQPDLIIAVGKLAIVQFIPCPKLDLVIGKSFALTRAGRAFDLVPLPHPSGASPWPHQEPGRTLLPQAMNRIVSHAAWRKTFLREKS